MEHRLRCDGYRHYWLDNELLTPEPSQSIINHSPDGFNHGYGGSGPAQLAAAIVLRLTGKIDGYQQFKWDVIATLPQEQGFDVVFEYPKAGE